MPAPDHWLPFPPGQAVPPPDPAPEPAPAPQPIHVNVGSSVPTWVWGVFMAVVLGVQGAALYLKPSPAPAPPPNPAPAPPRPGPTPDIVPAAETPVSLAVKANFQTLPETFDRAAAVADTAATDKQVYDVFAEHARDVQDRLAAAVRKFCGDGPEHKVTDRAGLKAAMKATADALRGGGGK